MSKNIFASALLLLLSVGLQAQNNIRIGIQANAGLTLPSGIEISSLQQGKIVSTPEPNGKFGLFAYRNMGENLRLKLVASFGRKSWAASCDCSKWPSEQMSGIYQRDPKLDDQIELITNWVGAHAELVKSYGQARFRPFWSFSLGMATNIARGSNVKSTLIIANMPTDVQEQAHYPVQLGINLGFLQRKGFSFSVTNEVFLTKTQLKSGTGAYRYITPGIELGYAF